MLHIPKGHTHPSPHSAHKLVVRTFIQQYVNQQKHFILVLMPSVDRVGPIRVDMTAWSS